MSDVTPVEAVCPRCGRPYGRSRNANAAVTCACGGPVQPAAEPAADPYDLAPQASSPGTTAKPHPATIDQNSRTLAYRTPKDEKPSRAEPQTIRDLYLPLWLLAGGVVVEIVAAAIRERELAGALIYVGVELVFGTALMLAGLLVVSWVRKIDFGPFWVAVFKLTAISVAPAAAVALLTPVLNVIPLGGIIGWAGGFALYFALLGALFDLDQSDTWYCVCVIFLVHVAVYFAVLHFTK